MSESNGPDSRAEESGTNTTIRSLAADPHISGSIATYYWLSPTGSYVLSYDGDIPTHSPGYSASSSTLYPQKASRKP